MSEVSSDATPTPKDNTTQAPSLLHEFVDDAAGLVLGKEKPASAPSTRDTVESFATEALKFVPLFLPGSVRVAAKVGTYALSGVLWGLDNVHAGQDNQWSQFGLGALKGIAARGAFDMVSSQTYRGLVGAGVDRASTLLGRSRVPIFAQGLDSLKGMPVDLASKAWGLGISNRLSDSLLTEQTYTDKSGKFNFGTGLSKAFTSTFNPASLGTDVAFFAASPLFAKAADAGLALAAGKINALAAGSESLFGTTLPRLPGEGIIARSQMASTAITAGGFGYLSGMTGELQRQYEENRQNGGNERYDFSKAVRAGLWQAGTTVVGSLPGGFAAGREAVLTEATSNDLANSQHASQRRDAAAAEATGNTTASPIFAMKDGARRQPQRLLPGPKPRLLLPPPELPPDLDVRSLLGIADHFEVGTQTDPRRPFLGAVQYETADGQRFAQLPHGPIVGTHQDAAGKAMSFLWTPAGSRYASLLAHGGNVAMLDASQGRFVDLNGKPIPDSTFGMHNTFDELSAEGARPTDETQAQLDALAMPLAPFEPTTQSDLRLLPAPDGQPYKLGRIEIARLATPESADGSYQQPVVVGKDSVLARTYYMLTKSQTQEFANLRDGLLLGQMNEADYDFARRAREQLGEPSTRLSRQEYQDGVERLRLVATKIMVPETLARRLEAVDDLNRIATLPPELFPDMREKILEANRQLFLSPYGQQHTPLSLAQLIPFPHRLRGGILLLDENHNGVHGATDSPDSIRIYGDYLNIHQQVRTVVAHEVGHLVAVAHPDLTAAQELAYKLSSFEGSRRNTKDASEAFADNFGRMLADPDPELLFTLGEKDPIQTVILGEALRRELSIAGSDVGSLDRGVLEDRLKLIDGPIADWAQQKVQAYLQDPSAASAYGTLKLISTLAADAKTLPLARQLVNAKNLSADVNRIAAIRNPSYADTATAAYEMQALRSVSPSWYRSHRAVYDRTIRQLAAQNDAILRGSIVNADPSRLNAVLNLAEGLPGDGRLFATLFDRSALEKFAIDPPTVKGGDAEQDRARFAQRALSVLTRDGSQTSLQSALRILDSNSPARGLAAKFALEHASGAALLQTVEAIGRQMDAHDISAVSSTRNYVDSLIETMSGQGNAALPELVSSVDRGLTASSTVRQLESQIRGSLLERLIAAQPWHDLGEMNERLLKLRQQRSKLRQSLMSELEEDGDSFANFWMLKKMAQSEDCGLAQLARDLVPRDALEATVGDLTRASAANRRDRQLVANLRTARELMQVLYGT